MKIAFISNICPHYRVKTYELLSKYLDTDFYFFSAGDEWYWQSQHGVKQGNFKFEYLPGFHIGKSRLVPSLITKLFRNHYDVFIKCINGRFVLPIAYLIARIKGVPFILWTGIWMRLDTPFHKFFYPVTKFIYHHSDAIVVYGEHVKRFLVQEGVNPSKIFVTTHAVDNEFYNREVSVLEQEELLEKLGISNNQKIILYLGRLEPIKGLEYLIEAFSKIEIEGSVLILAGDGSIRESLEEQVESLGCQNKVIFAGYTSQADSVIYYSLARGLVLPSVTTKKGKETWGLVVNEAMLQGVPVITTDAVGAAAGGLVRDGWNGFVLPERDSDELADAISKILSDNSLRDMMSKNAKTIMDDWNNENMVLAFRQAVDYVNLTN
jgi:glycosyltransferase involved in cell wall biosynthesis